MRTKFLARHRRAAWIVTAVLLMTTLGAGVAGAQAPKVEVAGGYAYLRETEVSLPGGWFVSGGASVNGWFGVVGTVTGHYKTETVGRAKVDTRLHTFMGGPKFTYRTERLTPYLTLLAGGARVGARAAAPGVTAPESETRLAAQSGVGLDVNVSSKLGVRVGVNGLYTRGDAWDDWAEAFQFITGVVARW
jgi:Outer membrane protein beta-barrel domain